MSKALSSRVILVVLGAGALLASACGGHAADAAAKHAAAPPGEAPPGMVWIPPGTFSMGDDGPYAWKDEAPIHPVSLDGFWMDESEVTVVAFRAFVEASGYVTTAERAPDLEEIMAMVPEGTPPPPPELLVPGALVFHESGRPGDDGLWWDWKPGADWRHPWGPDAPAAADDQPVTQVSWDDAVAYCSWAKKRLPTEAEWEYAARGGMEQKPFVWGDAREPAGHPEANLWDGTFPIEDLVRDGFHGTSPVKRFAPNGYGLYDMAGNVWEWTADWYRPDTYAQCKGVVHDPKGPDASYDPDEPTLPKRVSRGGSFLCSDNYCMGYRPSARMKTSPDTGLVHTGFRAVRSAP